MGIEHKLLRHACVKIMVTLRSLIQWNDRCVDDLSDRQTVVQDGLHKRSIVFQHWRLARVEPMRLCPPQTETHA